MSDPTKRLDLQALLQAFGAQQQQSALTNQQTQLQTQKMRAAQQREALSPVHMGMSGGIIDPTSGKEAGNPFDTGFFKTAGERAGVEQAHLGYGGASTATGAQAVDPNILMPGRSFDFTAPDNSVDQILTEPPVPGDYMAQAPGAIDRTARAMAQMKRQRGASFGFPR